MTWAALELTSQIEAILWFIGVGIIVYLSVFFFKRYRKTEFQARTFFFGLGTFTLSFGIARLIENIRKYFLSTSLTDIVDAWRAGEQITDLNWILRVTYYAIAWVGIAIFYVNLEKFVFKGKTKYLLMVAALVEGSVSIALYNVQPGSTLFSTLLVVATVGLFVCGIFPVVMFFYVGKQAVGSVRIGSILGGIAILLFVVGVLADLPETAYVTGSAMPLPAWLTGFTAPIFLVTGLCLMAVAFQKIYAE